MPEQSGPMPMVEEKKKQKRGFACMTPEKQRELARRGGIAAHKAGTAHEWTADAAKAAGHKGGTARHANRVNQLVNQQEP